MRTKPTLSLVLILALACCKAVAEDSRLSSVGFEISWSSIDAGAAELAADGWRLSATVGQPDVSITPMQGGGYELRNGYWLTSATSTDVIFANGFD
jgi:hypothetical protein